MYNIICSKQVYDVTKFLEDHPGGDEVLISSTGTNWAKRYLALHLHSMLMFPQTVHAQRMYLHFFAGKWCLYSCVSSGKDATDDFEDVGHSSTAKAMMDEFYVGDIDTASIPKKMKYVPPKQPHYNQDKTPEFIIKLLQFLVPLIILGVAVGIRFYSKSA